MLRRDANNRFHKSALAIALTVGGVAAILQPLSGDLLAKMVAKNLPVKLAALEGQFATEKGAPLRIGGIPDEGAGVTRYAIQIPYGLSILAYNDPNAAVKGLNDFPATERPPVAIVHVSFQIMVACGMAMMGVAALAGHRITHVMAHGSLGNRATEDAAAADAIARATKSVDPNLAILAIAGCSNVTVVSTGESPTIMTRCRFGGAAAYARRFQSRHAVHHRSKAPRTEPIRSGDAD